MVIFLYLVWFSWCSSLFWELRDQESRKVAILSLKPRSHDVRILIDGFFPLDFTNFKIF